MLNTRIRLKYDTYANWTTEAAKKIILLEGEVALVAIPKDNNTLEVNSVSAPQVLMKVGDGSTEFQHLPWISAKAADVHSWAKLSWDEFVTEVKKIKVSNAENSDKLGNQLPTYYATAQSVTDLNDRVDGLEDEIDDVRSSIPAEVGVMSVTGSEAIKTEGTSAVTVSLKINNGTNNVVLAQNDSGLSASVDLSSYALAGNLSDLSNAVDDIVDGTTKVAVALKAEDSDKLGGELPSYYASADDVEAMEGALTSGAFKVGEAKHADDADKLGGQAPSYYATAQSVADLDDRVDEVVEIAEGKTKTYVTNTVKVTSLATSVSEVNLTGSSFKDIDGNTISFADIHIGDILLLTDVEYPDRWVSKVTLGENGSGTITLTYLETRKIDLEPYQTKTITAITVDNTSVATVEGALSAINTYGQKIEGNLGDLSDSVDDIIDGTTKVAAASNADDAGKLDGHDSLYFATAASVTNIVNGTTKVGKAGQADSAADADKLDGHDSLYFATTQSVADLSDKVDDLEDSVGGRLDVIEGVVVIDSDNSSVSINAEGYLGIGDATATNISIGNEGSQTDIAGSVVLGGNGSVYITGHEISGNENGLLVAGKELAYKADIPTNVVQYYKGTSLDEEEPVFVFCCGSASKLV